MKCLLLPALVSRTQSSFSFSSFVPLGFVVWFLVSRTQSSFSSSTASSDSLTEPMDETKDGASALAFASETPCFASFTGFPTETEISPAPEISTAIGFQTGRNEGT